MMKSEMKTKTIVKYCMLQNIRFHNKINENYIKLKKKQDWSYYKIVSDYDKIWNMVI